MAWALALRFALASFDERAQMVRYWDQALAEGRDLKPMVRAFISAQSARPGDRSLLTAEAQRLLMDATDPKVVRAIAYMFAGCPWPVQGDLVLLQRKRQTATDPEIRDVLDADIAYLQWALAGHGYRGPAGFPAPPW